MPEENRWRRAHDEDVGIGEAPMGDNTDNCSTDTIPIPVLDVERKTLPGDSQGHAPAIDKLVL